MKTERAKRGEFRNSSVPCLTTASITRVITGTFQRWAWGSTVSTRSLAEKVRLEG